MTAVSTIFTRPDYLTTDPATLADRKAFLRTVWQAIAPELELRYGVYNSTVAAPSAIFSQAIIDSLELWRQNTQLANLLSPNTPIDIQNEFLELFLDNYRVVRKAGVESIGLVRLIFSANTSYAIGPTDTFVAKGIIFRPTEVFSIYPSTYTAVGLNSQALQALDDGTFAATIELQSDEVLPAANLAAGTQLILEAQNIAALLDATVVETFVGSAEADTAETLIPKLINGITAPVLTSRANISALLKSLPDIGLQEVSVIGAGDIESVRDKHGLFNISQGGAGDVYVRTAGTVLTKSIMKTCYLVDAATAKYRCYLTKDDAIAAYEIEAINSEVSSHGLQITDEIRSFDLTGSQYAPDISNYAEAAFSRYQTIIVDFLDDPARFTGGPPQTAEYKITYSSLPYIKELQDYVSNRQNLSVMGDLLIKAAIPCKTFINFSVAIQQGQSAPDLNALTHTVVATISNTSFMNVLPASIIIEALQQRLPLGMFISDFVMLGELLLPTEGKEGKVLKLQQTASSAKEELTFNVLPYATANTICFFTDITKVNAQVKTYSSMARFR